MTNEDMTRAHPLKFFMLRLKGFPCNYLGLISLFVKSDCESLPQTSSLPCLPRSPCLIPKGYLYRVASGNGTGGRSGRSSWGGMQ